ncbi:MAG: recombinase family protein, partial [Calditrichaeota bacterium]
MTVVALYARVSTQHQALEATIESQIAQLERYAQVNGFTIPAAYRFLDEAVSGRGLQRPALTRLRDAAMSGVFSAVLCLSPDRLSRNLGIQQFLLSEWKRLNIQVIFINRPRAVQTPQDALLLNIEGAFAEYERTVISDRMQRGRRHKLQQGHAVPYPCPYGYQYVSATAHQRSRWVVDQAQAAVIEQIFLWYTEERISCYRIAQRLNEQKAPAPAGKQWY